MRRTTWAATVAVAVLATTAPAAQDQREKIDREVIWKIRTEAAERSQIMHTLHMLTDVYGPRLTGSPNLKAASDWIVKQTTAWGLKNAHLEPWDFGRPGWHNDRTAAFMTAPVKDSLVAEALAWTPSTNGVVRAAAVQLELPRGPTRDQLEKHLAALRPRVEGRIILLGPPERVPVTILPSARRRDDNDVRNTYGSDAPAPGGPGGPPAAPAGKPDPNVLSPVQVADRLNEFLIEAKVAVRINDAGRDHGQIRAFNNRSFDVTKSVPTLVMRNEDYGRIWRLLDSKIDVQMEVEIVNQIYPEGKTQYNVIAELPGTDRAQEVVMLGGHLDSWHAATGATDNAIGCAVMMEAIRILQAIGVKPRRTIRLALWSGEEQGLLGSQAYVRDHFGTFENPKPEFQHFAGYFNIDSGTGRARGMTVFGPPQAASILRQALAPFADTGVAGATTTRSRRRGGSDHTSFNEAGLPGIGIGQDPIEYGTYTWHTNLDTYERIIESDAQQSAMAIAAAVYHLAMRDDKLPRFSKEQMPAPPTPPSTTSQ